jgi:hypothetical protein
MKDRSPLSLLIRGFLLVMLIDLAAIAVVAMLGWWSGWIYLEAFQRAIQLAGILVIAIGAVGLVVNLSQERAQNPGSLPTHSPTDGGEPAPKPPGIWWSRYGFTVIFVAAGCVCLLIAVLLV